MYQAKKNSKSLRVSKACHRRNGATHACEQRCIHCTDPASVTILVKGPSPDIIKSHFREVVEPQYWNDIIEVSKFTRFKHWTQRIVQTYSPNDQTDSLGLLTYILGMHQPVKGL
ncbi:hypothetical protein AQUCO_00900259v1 [Aquilegia coerulea]|uniref:Uncharacterized protein n=1 Tax=Aquilegia coerulea TaxID=218851 RepID=A0A2G5ECR6_AQUCA|nr:hypothetical protein AQUCO_00900259v1 [Aquilegia coerulea]